ncbi:glycosyltransferase [Parabacteroides massiliensis]|uniref:glycosyltransferase n=1 Tax=Parabacteroides massiliensis TaxID=1750560 RepID=UPI00096AC724|nr:glycosyltransferase [Parabacteroides massiliensis]
MKELSIIIPVYNVQNYLEDCLLSIYKQSLSLETFEVIAVNDGSTDKSIDILRKYEEIYPNMIIISQKNSGQSVARNNGLTVASGKYVFFMDSDDYLCLDSLASLLSKATEHDLDVLRFDYKYVDEEGHELDKKTNRDKRMQYSGRLVDGQFLYEHLYQGEFFCLSLIKRSFLLKYSIQYKEGAFFEDVEYALKIAYHANKVVYMDSCIYAYRQRGTSTIYTIDKKKVTDIIGASISVLQYIEDPSLGNGFKNVIKETVTSLMVFALLRIAELKEREVQKSLCVLIHESGISHLQPGKEVKEYIISCGFNVMGGWNVVRILYPVVWLKKKLRG